MKSGVGVRFKLLVLVAVFFILVLLQLVDIPFLNFIMR
jgi:hypothetical protein